MIDEKVGNASDTAGAANPEPITYISTDEIDPELNAMRIIHRVLGPLDLETRNRVLSWVERRLSPAYKSAAETPEQRRHREAVERGKLSWANRRARE